VGGRGGPGQQPGRRARAPGSGPALLLVRLCALAAAGLFVFAWLRPGAFQDVGDVLRGSQLRVVVGALGLVLFFAFAALAARLQRRSVLDRMTRHGRPAVATVVQVAPTGRTVKRSPEVKYTLKVQPEDQAPFTMTGVQVLSGPAMLAPGMVLPVIYDPAQTGAVLVVGPAVLPPQGAERPPPGD
jgi:hypothetical protein